MQPEISVIVFDVNETLSDMSPLTERFTALGCPASVKDLWFTSVLRDGFAATAAGTLIPFGELAAGNMRPLLLANGRAEDTVDDDITSVLAAFPALDVHPDVPAGLIALADRGLRLFTLTVGAPAMTEPMFRRAGVHGVFERFLGADVVGHWKPAPQPYHYAAAQAGVAPEQMALVAVHPWDIHGAQRAGLTGVWINRGGAAYPPYLPEPDITISDLGELAQLLPQP